LGAAYRLGFDHKRLTHRFQGRDFLVGAVVGALIALTGVAVGIAAGRR